MVWGLHCLRVRHTADKSHMCSAATAGDPTTQRGVQALLLVLVGGVTKEMDDGMRLRGDIHACLMGDIPPYRGPR